MPFVHVLVVAHPAGHSTNFANLQIMSTLRTYHYGLASQDQHWDWQNFFVLKTLPCLVRVMCRPQPALLPAKISDVNFFAFSADLDLVSTSSANPFFSKSLINN
jgi:hypothetical protein